MHLVRNITGILFAAVMVALFTPATAKADHLDRYEIKQVARHLQEKNDALLDRIDDWIAERRDEREHRAEELRHRADHFESVLEDFRVSLRDKDEPWALRDQAQGVLDAAADLGHLIEHGEYHEGMGHEWEAMRDQANELARRFHLHEIGR